MAERSVTVRDSSARPTEVCIAAKREQILAWLEDTSPVEVHDRGMTYAKVAENIRSLADALPEVGAALNGAWRAGSAAKTQQALRKLQASGSRLATAMQDMSDALTLYGRDYLPQAIEEARKDASGDQGDDGPARQALEKLNRRIISLYENKIPETVSVDLPEVSPAGAPETRRMPLETQTPYRQGDYWNGGGSDSGASNGSGPYGSTGSHGGTGTSGSNAGSDSGSDGGRDGGRDSGRDSGTGDDPAAESPASPGDQTGSTGDQTGQSPAEQNPGDGTTPAVIDNNTTDTPGDTKDPGSTESANAPVQNPPTTHMPVTQQPVGSQPPGTPAVIGGGGSYTQAAAVGAGSARPAIGGMGMGMPFFPMGGAAGGEQSQDQERSTYLTEDRDMWHPGERSTSPVIGA
ncbi:hypothetical protein FE391_45245 [Nonomuraea sp. KC401]|uniref:WXG100 family type VII secretion target n=1 Tax=unclassified Nonomuraea TaxID=2593643 RepID=UPI0010FCEA66|nr:MULTISPECIES: hypothetical protein [unclassified Nonomuraea]NBE99231.1 hypothetical protein [Nonomuraea sp. K271]TLF49605.1 hypothetical protein FE391_45245 [Nonomuraea sp. KC401]